MKLYPLIHSYALKQCQSQCRRLRWLSLAGLALAAGCGDSKSLVGTWVTRDFGEAKFTFNADKTLTVEVPANVIAPSAPAVKAHGTYELTKRDFIWTYTDLPTGPGMPEHFVRLFKVLNGKPEHAFLDWDSSDKMHLTEGQKIRKFVRTQ
jgi:hypothetical protein